MKTLKTSLQVYNGTKGKLGEETSRKYHYLNSELGKTGGPTVPITPFLHAGVISVFKKDPKHANDFIMESLWFKLTHTN